MSKNQSIEIRYMQGLRRQAKRPRYFCSLCTDGLRSSFPDERALFDHLHRRHEPDLHNLRNDPDFNEQKWKTEFKAQALAEG